MNFPAAHLQLNTGVSVDLRDAIDAAKAHEPERGGRRRDTYGVPLSGEVPPSWHEYLVLIERERLRQLRLHARKAVCARLTAAGRPGEAVDLGLAAVAGDPLRESAHRALIQAHLAEGNRADAVRQYQAYREILRDALGVSPSARLKALMTDGLADPPPDVVADRALWGRHRLRAKDGAVTPAYPDARCRPRVDEEEAR